MQNPSAEQRRIAGVMAWDFDFIEPQTSVQDAAIAPYLPPSRHSTTNEAD